MYQKCTLSHYAITLPPITGVCKNLSSSFHSTLRKTRNQDRIRRGKKSLFSKYHLHALYISVEFILSVVSDSLQPHEPQHARPPYPSPTPRVHSNPCPLSRWCHPTISSCRPFLLLPSIFPSTRVFSNESALCISCPKYQFQLQHQSYRWTLSIYILLLILIKLHQAGIVTLLTDINQGIKNRLI